MSKVLKTITMSLTPTSIDNAIREVKAFRKQLVDCCGELVRKLTDDGVTIAKMNVMSMNAVYTGELEDSIEGVYFPREKMGVIFTSVPYALFVEYGTGIVGERSPHPDGGAIEWDYDVHGHGDEGWVYYCDTDGFGRFRWTKGMAARPYMYNTYRWLMENAERIAGTVIK